MSPYTRMAQQMTPIYAPQPQVIVQQKPSLWESYRQAILPAQTEPVSSIQSAVAGLRGNLESAAIAAILGTIHGRFGTLDIAGKYPVDAILGAFLYALSVKDSGKPDGFATDLRNLSQACTSVAVFRKTSEWSKPKTDSSPDMSRHKTESDPLIEFAKKNGLAA